MGKVYEAQRRFNDKCDGYIHRLEDQSTDPVIVAAMRTLMRSNAVLRGQIRALLVESQRFRASGEAEVQQTQISSNTPESFVFVDN